MTDKHEAMELLSEFYTVVDSIYGVYLDSTRGFYLVKDQHIKEQQWAIQVLKKTRPDLANIEYLDKQKAMYGIGDPNKPDSVILHACSQAELKARNEERGDNQKFIANMCLVSIYQYWEDEYRKKIEQALGMKRNALQSDIMGDIRRLRKSIIHHKAIALKEVGKCKKLKWFKEDDEIFIDKKMFEEIIRQIYIFINKLAKELCYDLENPISK